MDGVKDSVGIEAVVARLRESRLKRDAELLKQGTRDGREWAERFAEAHELEALASLEDFGEDPLGTIEAALGLDYGTAQDHWHIVTGDGHHPYVSSSAYLEGFVQGAVTLWRQVELQL